jgi:hypothetical protein
MLDQLGPRVRLRLAIGGAGLVVVLAAFGACGACGKRLPAGATSAAATADAMSPQRSSEDASVRHDAMLWEQAQGGSIEDLAALAAHEGAIGLTEGAADPALRSTAIRAMAYARGWAQLPFLVQVANGKSDDETNLALDAAVELAVRPRLAEDPEDFEELREGCQGLVRFVRDDKRARAARVLAMRALRMMPCPPPETLDGGAELPRDLDAK